MTLFLINSSALNQKLSDIFTLLIDSKPLEEEFLLSDKSEKFVSKFKGEVLDKMVLLENLFLFWQKMIQLLLHHDYMKNHYSYRSKWIENLLFSIEYYLHSYEKLNKLIDFAEKNNEVLMIDQEFFEISKVKPDYDVIKSLVDLLKSYETSKQGNNILAKRSYTNNHLTTLWSLVFETLACINNEKIKEENILEDLITTLLSSSIELQEITYLVQTNYKISPN